MPCRVQPWCCSNIRGGGKWSHMPGDESHTQAMVHSEITARTMSAQCLLRLCNKSTRKAGHSSQLLKEMAETEHPIETTLPQASCKPFRQRRVPGSGSKRLLVYGLHTEAAESGQASAPEIPKSRFSTNRCLPELQKLRMGGMLHATSANSATYSCTNRWHDAERDPARGR